MKIGVVGAGNMGAGIAQKYATEGKDVVVVDVDQAAADRGRDRVRTTLDEGVARKIFTPEKRDQILAHMTFTSDRDQLKGAALVVEAIFEDKLVKQELFKDLDARLGKETILATNTSSFYVDDVAEVCKHKDRVVGLHYFYHPAKNRLVEVIKGTSTSPEAFQKAWAIQEDTGKIPVESGDAPGFIVNRFFVPWLNESMRLVEEGMNIATVEHAAKRAFGVGMGPFELMNVTGVPITLHAATTLGAELSKFYEPCALIRPVVARKGTWDLTGDVDETKYAAVSDRLWGAVAQIACTMVLEEKVCSVEDCDLGARVGLRWPKGPFEAMNAMGTERALSCVRKLVARHPDLKVPQALVDVGDKNAPFDVKLVSTRVQGGVGTICFERPDVLNALNESIVAQLGIAFAKLEGDASVKGIVLQGRGKAFVAGADTKFFVEQIEQKNVARIVKYAADGQKLFARIDACSKPVICKLHGLSLGGGSELALACDFIVATKNGSLGFPETGIGIYPGLGGTQRSARRVGIPLARLLILTGETVDAMTGKAMGLIDDVVDASELDAVCNQRALAGVVRKESAPPTTAPKGFEEAWRTLTFTSVVDLLKGSVTVVDDKLKKSVKKGSFKAPLAMLAADELIKLAATASMAEGLARETAGLARIFSSKDAYEGLSTLGVRRPSFKGQ